MTQIISRNNAKSITQRRSQLSVEIRMNENTIAKGLIIANNDCHREIGERPWRSPSQPRPFETY